MTSSEHPGCDWRDNRKFILEALDDIRTVLPEIRGDVRELRAKLDDLVHGMVDREMVSAMIAASFDARDKKRVSGQMTVEDVQRVAHDAAEAVIASRKNNNGKTNDKLTVFDRPVVYVIIGAAIAFGKDIFVKLLGIS